MEDSSSEGRPPTNSGAASTPWPLWVRWGTLAVAMFAGFHTTIFSVVQQARYGGPLTYLLLFPLWAAIVGVGTQLRRRNELDIHDRQTDWLAGLAVGVLIVMLVDLLSPRLHATASLVRLDVFEMLLFAIFGCILLFGMRATGRYWAAWFFLAACWPLLYRFGGTALGGAPQSYAAINIGLSAASVAVGVGGRLSWRSAAALMTATFGAVVLFTVGRAPVLVQQLVPAAVAPLAVLYLVHRIRTSSAQAQERTVRATGRVRKPAVAAPWGAALVILTSAAFLWLGRDLTPPELQAKDLIALPGSARGTDALLPSLSRWSAGKSVTYPWARRYFGPDSSVVRTRFYSGTTPTNEVVIDRISAADLEPLNAYPGIACYKITAPYVEQRVPVDLGHGIKATLYYANTYAAYDPIESEWVMLTWTWKTRATSGPRFERVTVLALNGEPLRNGIPSLAQPWGDSIVRDTFSTIIRAAVMVPSSGAASNANSRVRVFAQHIIDAAFEAA